MILIHLMIFFISPENALADSRKSPVVINLAGGDYGYPTPFSHYPRGPGIYKMFLIFDSLLEKGENGHIPWLAEKWDISGDGRVYTFHLKKNVQWHDGAPMTAADVKFSFEYFSRHPAVSDDLNIDGKSFIQKIHVTDTHTVSIHVEKPFAPCLGKIGRSRIIPKHVWEAVSDPRTFDDPKAVIGCGPYVLKAYNREQGAYQFAAFPGYWGPKPRVDVIQFVPVSDEILAFHAGEIDLTGVAPDLIKKYADNPDYQIRQNPGFWGYRLILNLEKRPEFRDKTLRQALATAIDRNELVQKVARGAAIPASAGYLPRDHVWYNSRVREYDFDTDRAKALLQGKTMSVDLLISNTRDELRIAELMKISLARAGIHVTVKSVDMKTRDAAIRNSDYEMVLNGHGGWGMDADLLRTVYAGGKSVNQSPFSDAIPGYSHPKINDLCERQHVEMDEIRRRQMIFELQELIAEGIPQIPLYNTTGHVVYRPARYNGWRYMFDHHDMTHNKLSYLTPAK